jgi:hypothetical protein
VNELRLGYSRGEAVFLSRPLCDEYGESLCRFVEAHEHAHHYTKTVGHKSSCAETLADCWAAAHADRDAVEAALLFFRSLRGSGGYHGEPSVRAEVIAHCLQRREQQAELRVAAASEAGGIDESAESGGNAHLRVLEGADGRAPSGAPSTRARPERPFRILGRGRHEPERRPLR